MPWPVHPNGLLGAQGDNDNYQISRSLRFNSADSAYLNRTPASSGNTQKFTYSAWVKIASTATSQEITLLGAGTGAQTNLGNDNLQLRGNGTGLQIGLLGQGGTGGNYSQFTAYHRDPSSWQHVIVSVDTTQATQANRCRAYFNGVEETSAVNNTFGSAYSFTHLNTTAAHLIGRGNEAGGPNHTDAYLTEINFIDGQALTPSSFGETDAVTGRWKAKAYSGSYGTNGFYLKFADNSSTAALGTDSSGNGNTWDVNNFSVTAGAGNDSLVDSPTNYGSDSGVGGEVRGNYATLNPLSNNGGTMVDGNLDFYGPSAWRFAGGTIAVSSGKWYIEATHFGASVGNTEGNTYSFIGFIKPSTIVSAGLSHTSYTSSVIGIGDSGWAYNFASGSSVTTGFGSGDIASVSIDFTTGSYNIRKNNTSIASGTMAFTGELIPAIFSYESTYRWQPNFGQRPFAYAAPSGFKALCTTNLTTPTIKKPSTAMDVVTYTGTGASNSISSLGFSPDLVWIKNRGGATSHALYDTTRLATKQLSSDTTGDEATSSTGLTAFGSNGFTIGTSTLVNTSGTQYVAWAWDESPQDGFDIVSYTGNGANRTISHNLGVAPKMLIVKARTTAGADQAWPVWHTSIANTTYLQLNSTSATATGADYWNSTSPTSSVFSVGANAAVNANNDTYIGYCFAEIEGFSKFGSYTGNGSADGPFVYCGFRPRWVMYKRTDSTENWVILDSARDTFNVSGGQLILNSSSAEGTGSSNIDIVSNGFKMRSATAGGNVNNGTYIFAAFAEQPFKYARAR